MSDRNFGDYTNRNIVKNPLLSTAVTGLSLEDLTHNAVLIPVSLSQEAITRPVNAIGPMNKLSLLLPTRVRSLLKHFQISHGNLCLLGIFLRIFADGKMKVDGAKGGAMEVYLNHNILKDINNNTD